MEQQNTNIADAAKKRPGFLKVLCILSFIGIGFAVIGGIYNLLTFQTAIEGLRMASAFLGDVGESFDKFIQWGTTVYIINIVAALLCLVGVYMMWNLKKTGFYIYLIGEIAPAIASFALIGGFGPFGTMAMVAGLIFPINA